MSGIDPKTALEDWLDPPRREGDAQWCHFCEDWGHSSQDKSGELCPVEALAAEIQAHEETRREVERLRIGLMNAAHEAGQDPGGMTHPDQLVHPDIVEYALAAVRELRELYSEALEET